MLDGSIKEYDFAKELAQVIFQNTQDIGEHAFSMELYKNPIVELTEDNKRIIKDYTDKYFKAFVKVAVNKIIEFNSND
ncbi:MAG TPA: hypothetical protein GXZ48_08125 [Acholeplasmataceae bacterium]|nr:hypothetical protein [Acholeplasmataceae bacterium]